MYVILHLYVGEVVFILQISDIQVTIEAKLPITTRPAHLDPRINSNLRTLDIHTSKIVIVSPPNLHLLIAFKNPRLNSNQ